MSHAACVFPRRNKIRVQNSGYEDTIPNIFLILKSYYQVVTTVVYSDYALNLHGDSLRNLRVDYEGNQVRRESS